MLPPCLREFNSTQNKFKLLPRTCVTLTTSSAIHGVPFPLSHPILSPPWPSYNSSVFQSIVKCYPRSTRFLPPLQLPLRSKLKIIHLLRVENKVGEVNALTGQRFGRVIFVDTKITKNYARSEYVERVTLSQEGYNPGSGRPVEARETMVASST